MVGSQCVFSRGKEEAVLEEFAACLSFLCARAPVPYGIIQRTIRHHSLGRYQLPLRIQGIHFGVVVSL